MKLFLIDGHALIFKMYYAFLGRPMVNTKGVDTSILFGFTKYLLELISKEKPTHIAVSFDPPGGTFRNRLYPEYKANRGETPQLVIDALEPLCAIVKAMNIPVLMVPDFEADDVIGSMARRSAGEGFEVYMVTPDKDYGQLVGSGIYQYRPGKAGENEVLGPAEVCAKWGIDNPGQVIDMLAICGDAADNVPGVAGVGPVGASKLVRKYGSLEGIYDHLQELTPRQREQFEAARDHMALSRELVTIRTDIVLETSADDMKLNLTARPELAGLFDLYEFGSLKKKLDFSLVPQTEEPVPVGADVSYARAASPDELVRGSGPLAVEMQGSRLIAARCEGAVIRIACGSAAEFNFLLEDASLPKLGYGLKSLLKLLESQGITLAGELLDIELMHYLLNPERNHQLEQLCLTYLGVQLDEKVEKEASLFDDDTRDDEESLMRRVAAMLRLREVLAAELDKQSMTALYDRIEGPLIRVLAAMERNGVFIDLASLKDFTAELRTRMLDKEAEVREIAGIPELNPASPKQLGEVIFEKLKLDPGARKPKSGNWPTDEQTLTELSDRSPIIDAILEYRGLRKLLSTYIEPLPGYISPLDGRVHTTFNQALTSTGRLSSSNPNLQNIPVRSEQGREIRAAFVPGRDGCVMMSADYSQIELRIMAHLCGDEHMIEAFRRGVDVHAATAAKIFRKPLSDVTADERRVAKTANFGIMYGISAFGLAQRLNCSRSEAKNIIEDYFASFPSIRSFIDRTLQEARANGYVQTLLGRRRYVPDVNSHSAQVRAFAERNAVNAPIQGTAADIMKLAMIAVDRRLREEGLKSLPVLQIHDELVLEVPAEEIDRVSALLVTEMQNVMELSVPLTVECNYGKNWLEAH